jgi:hypothetical protein
VLDYISEVGRGLGEVPSGEAQMRAHVMQPCVVRRQLQRGVFIGKRALVIAFPGQCDRAADARADIIRRKLKRLGVVRDGAVIVTARMAYPGARRIGQSFSRIEAQCGVVVGQRPDIVPLQLVSEVHDRAIGIAKMKLSVAPKP